MSWLEKLHEAQADGVLVAEAELGACLVEE
jgi:hypothetical protein